MPSISLRLAGSINRLSRRRVGSAGVLEIVEDEGGNTYRGVYTVRFPERVFVLHVFQKKSKQAVATPKPELDLVRDRLKRAEQIVKEWDHENKAGRAAR